MSVSALITNYAKFNEWANSEIVVMLQKLDTKYLHQHSNSSFASIDYTLQHILRAQHFWLLFIIEEDFSQLNWNVRENDAENVMNELQEISAQMSVKFAAFSEEELERKLVLDMPWAKNTRSRYDYIMHVINHSTFHRGQIITMLRGFGITNAIVNTDYNIFNCLSE